MTFLKIVGTYRNFQEDTYESWENKEEFCILCEKSMRASNATSRPVSTESSACTGLPSSSSTSVTIKTRRRPDNLCLLITITGYRHLIGILGRWSSFLGFVANAVGNVGGCIMLTIAICEGLLTYPSMGPLHDDYRLSIAFIRRLCVSALDGRSLDDRVIIHHIQPIYGLLHIR
uniref:Uncharacterized protein n=1 Tax=Vespula pensylvanica TaxID=30213 RepID=A0A834P410_VESPE|nr:hypothetical protein H0235_007119 [Vespula pensylvanica]